MRFNRASSRHFTNSALPVGRSRVGHQSRVWQTGTFTIAERQTVFTVPGASAPGQIEEVQ